MAITLGDLIEGTRHALSGYDQSLDAVAALADDMDETQLDVQIEDARAVGAGPVAARGLAEVDFEILRVKSTSPQDGLLTLHPFGRGYRGSRKAAHSAGAEIRFNPAFPAFTVAQHINGVLGEIYPLVYGVKTHETTVPLSHGAIDLPTTATGVVSVWLEDLAHEDQWFREDRWDFKRDATSIGRPLRIGGRPPSGHGVRVVYASRPGLFDLSGALTQDFATVTGLDERCADLIQIGVAARLAPFIDMAKLPFLSSAARESGDGKAPGVGASQTRLLRALFQQRVEQEAGVLAKEHPIRLHRVGV